MKKFKFLVGFGLKKRIYKKSFIITNAILGILIIGLINIPAIINYFDEDEPIEFTEIVVINETNDASYPLENTLLTYFNGPYEEDQYAISETTIEDYSTFWDQSDIDILLVFQGDLSQPDVDVYTKDSQSDSFVLSNIQTFLNDYQGINYGNYNIVAPPDTGEEGEIDSETRTFIEGIISILILPVFILIIMATQFLGVDIIEEKSSKAIETIIASVPAKIHFLSKILSNLLFLIIQSIVLLVFGAIGALIGRFLLASTDIENLSLLADLAARIPNWPGILVFTLLFMIFGTLFFLTLAAFIAAVATTQEDYQQFQAPLVFLILGGFYIAMFLPMLGLDNIVKIAAFVPLFSTLVAPIAYATGVLSILEAILALIVLIISVVIFMYFIAPIYRVAILSYEETKFFKRIKFYIKKAFSKK